MNASQVAEERSRSRGLNAVEPVLIRMASVTPQPLDWLWPGQSAEPAPAAEGSPPEPPCATLSNSGEL